MQQPATPESTSSEHDAVAASDTSRRDAAVEAMIAGVERLDELGLDGVETAAAFLWS